MRTKFLFLLLTLLLVGCEKAHEDTPIEEEIIALDYSDFVNLHLEWKNLFSPAKSLYFVYIYSISCGHCKAIKDDVLSFINTDKESFFLMEYSKEIPTSNNVADTIGKEKVEEIAILGTPTLLCVSNATLVLNIAGEKEIIDYLKALPHTDTCYFL